MTKQGQQVVWKVYVEDRLVDVLPCQLVGQLYGNDGQGGRMDESQS